MASERKAIVVSFVRVYEHNGANPKGIYKSMPRKLLAMGCLHEGGKELGVEAGGLLEEAYFREHTVLLLQTNSAPCQNTSLPIHAFANLDRL